MYYGISGTARLLRVIRHHRKLIVIFIILLALGAIFAYGRLVSDKANTPSVTQAKKVVSLTVAEVCENFMKENPDFADSCFSPISNGEQLIGYSLSADSLSEAERNIAEEVDLRLRKASRIRVSISSGSLSGISFFSGKGIPVFFSSTLISAVKTEPASSIESVGINHTLYRARLKISVSCELIMNGNHENFTLEFEKLLAEKVILGEVPLTN